MDAQTRWTSGSLCDAMCGLPVTVRDNHIVDLRGDPHDPHIRGHVCAKAHALRELREDPDRVRRPLVRHDGELQATSWDTAVDLTADQIAAVQRAHGPDAVAVYIANPVAHSHRTAQFTDSMMRCVVSLPHGHGHQDAVQTLRLAGQADAPNVNALTDPLAIEPVMGQPILNGVAVHLEAAYAA